MGEPAGVTRVGIAIRDSVTSSRWCRTDQVVLAWHSVNTWGVESDPTVGLDPLHRTIRSKMNTPHAFVNQMVMPGTQWHEVVEVGIATVLPRGDVVNLAMLE